MRCVASGGLFALGLTTLLGCNQIFGISQTVAYDAPTDVVADRTFVKLDWQLSTSTDAPVLLPISPMPAVRIAKLDDAAWTTPDTTAASYAGDSAIDIPRDYLAGPWRLEYTLADGIPHEVQWQPVDKMGQLTVPIFGRVQRDPLPVNSGYTAAPTGPAPSAITSSRLYTTGLWTIGPKLSPNDFVATELKSLSGLRGAIDQTKGDHALYIAYGTSGGCSYAIGSAPLDPATLIENARTATAKAWDTNVVAGSTPTVMNGDVTRIGELGDLVTTATGGALMYGFMPSADMPGLAATADASIAEGVALPMPVMVTLSKCPTDQTFSMIETPGSLTGLPRVLHAQITSNRVVLGQTLTSGLESTMRSTSGGFAMAFPAPLATDITITPPGQAAVSLNDDAVEQVPLAASSGAFVVTFKREAAVSTGADVYEIWLHGFSGTALTTERIYTVPAVANQDPSLRIDGALLAAGKTYALEIRTIKGHSKAPLGDFSAVEYPYGQTVVFPRTFKIQ